ncbi:MAG TPA: phosphotransferase family protein [Candidatus Binataceae bacterium]|nr:phosphotransferase family protein [Candidatus Binataceae bacterium]
MDVAELSERLCGFIREQGRLDDVTIENLHKMPGGASREIWSFDCTMTNARGTEKRSLVLRRDPGAQRIESNRLHEFLVLRAAFEEGVPVPEVFWVSEDPAVLDASFFIMQRVEGETIARRLLRDDEYANARRIMPAQLAQIAARIHTINPVKHKLDFLREPGPNSALTEVKKYEENFRKLALQPYPAFELTFRWLYERIPKTPQKALVHGDYRIGNIIFGPDGVRSILDWELAHLGDPMEDLGWMCVRAWRFGADENPVGGLGQREDFWAAYERASGISVDPAAARWWEVFGVLKWGIITISQARTHMDGLVSSVELASIGRRTVENELELLNLIE